MKIKVEVECGGGKWEDHIIDVDMTDTKEITQYLYSKYQVYPYNVNWSPVDPPKPKPSPTNIKLSSLQGGKL